MRTTKKILSMILAVVLVLGLLPATAIATGADSVYISVSYDGQYINDKNGNAIAYIPVSFDKLSAIDLDEYGLSEYKYDENGDGTYDITALHMVIYAHENLYGGDFSEVTFTGAPGSSYFQGGIFGFDENLNYFLNGEYPLAGEGWGATSDQIVLEAGDFIDIGSFSSWDFYMDSNYGFHFFADESGAFIHDYTAEAGSTCSVKLVRSYSGMGTGAVVYDASDYTVYYGTSYGNATGSVTTDGSGCAEITFPEAGSWILWADGGYGNEYSDVIVSAPAYAKVTVTAAEAPAPEEPEQPRESQSVTKALNATMAQLAATVTEPVFGTTAGEWTVLCLARGGYYAKDNAYFTDYYNRIVDTVNTTATKVNMSGALHKSKSTENSRLIVALSALGIDATSVGDWDLVEAYSANGFSWIKKQGLNGTIWALIALDSNNYATSDPTIRQQCVDAIVEAQHDDGGWSLMANKTFPSDPDITGMALTALYPYRNQLEVAEACGEAFDCLSAIQNDDGTYSSGGAKCSESCSWVIVSTTTWGINPDTDSRFIKNGKSVVDGLLAHYLPDSATFQHIIGAGSNAMATDQSCYALVAYDRFLNSKPALFDYSDVTFGAATPSGDEMVATLGLPAEINPGAAFNATVSINKWDNEAGYKLIDLIVNIPEGVSVTEVTASNRLEGGAISWNVEEETGKLRIVYFDANENTTLTITGEEFPAELFAVSFKAENVSAGSKLDIAISGMSVKLTSDSEEEASMVVVNTDNAKDFVNVVVGLSFSAKCLYTGDDVDIIPSTKKAVAVAVTGISNGTTLTYTDGINTIDFKYSAEISAKTGIATYVAMVDSSIAMDNFVNENYFIIPGGNADSITFGDTNGDGNINAQDALAAVDTWLRKGEEPTDIQILTMNVNGDSRINTFDALGIVEAFVNGTDYIVVTKAATITENQLLSLCACQGNFGSVNLNDAIDIPENGIIKESIIKTIQAENAIGIFTGESNGLRYEWTIFGSDITDAAEINLAVSITKTVNGDPKVTLSTSEPFGFSALLSVYLDEEWDAQSATGYVDEKAVVSVSLTGSKTTILNMTLDGSLEALVIRPDELPEEAYDPDVESPTQETTEATTQPTTGNDDYLSKPEDTDDTVYTDGKDKYLTDPIPEGKPKPEEPEDQEVDKGKTYTCTFSIECSTILNNLDQLDPDKLEMVPSGGVILSKTTVTFYEGESVFDVLQQVCKEKGIHMEAAWTPIYNSAYVEGIHNLYEFDCGALSGWMYKVNGWYPNYGSSRYQLKDGDTVEWRFTCDLGNDIGGGYAVGG